MEDRRKPTGDRRFGFGRRMIDDRREQSVEVPDDRRSGEERRTSEERRVLYDRRKSVRRLTRDPQQG